MKHYSTDRLTWSGPSEECGCPEEHWNWRHLEVIIHMEPDGRGQLFIDAGDWDHEEMFECSNIKELRNKARDWVYNLKEE